MRATVILLLAFSFLGLVQCKTTKTAAPPVPAVPFKAVDFPNIDSTIYGRWLASSARFANGIAYYGSLYINRSGQVGVAMTCQAGKRDSTAWVQVNGRVQGATLQILTSSQSTVPGPTPIAGCSVKVDAAAWTYQVNGDTLSLDYGDGERISYDRKTKHEKIDSKGHKTSRVIFESLRQGPFLFLSTLMNLTLPFYKPK